MNDSFPDIIEILAKFRADLIWDEMVGIFEQAPSGSQEILEKQYAQALEAAATKLGTDVPSLRERAEDRAIELVNGTSYSAADVRARLREYGVKVSEPESPS